MGNMKACSNSGGPTASNCSTGEVIQRLFDFLDRTFSEEQTEPILLSSGLKMTILAVEMNELIE